MLNSLFIGNQDGGIISTITQAPQSSEPVVIIGLGGTGVDAIIRLKTKLQRQIEPDNKNAVERNGDEPRYDHIKFLGIDADAKWLNNSGLLKEETLNIQNYNYNVIDGAIVCRQFGRWLTIGSANTIKMKLKQVMTEACLGRIDRHINVHIISSISGGMGAGSIVDVCYIAREVIDGLGFNRAEVFGYFVLPDAIISKAAISQDPIKTANNQKNGMSSLLEIEHLMNLKDSNEWFEQDYGSFSIRTQHRLVDMCHFVSSMNMNGVIVPNSYEYALNVIGDYILAFVSKEQVADGFLGIPPIAGIPPEHGRGNYHLIGAINAGIPITQMATYLASELFRRLTICRTMPNTIQLREFVDDLKLTGRQLENQIAQGGGWNQITEKLVGQYFDQIKAHMNDNVLPAAMIGPTEDSLRKRRVLLIQKREMMEKDVDAYVYQEGASSIPGLALNALIRMAEDPMKGPVYAYGMMNKTGEYIFDYLDDIRNYYALHKQRARDQETAFINEYEPAAKRDLGKSRFLNKSGNIKKYAETLNQVYYWQAQAELFEEMETLMANLTDVFRSMNDRYLKPLKEVTDELIETFHLNGLYFQRGKGDQSQDGFTKQLIPFSHIKTDLDGVIGKLDPATETGDLLRILTTHPEIWMEREELKLKAEISNYVLQKFNPILSESLESFLRKDLNMDTANSNVFADEILKKIIEPLVDQAVPLFWTNDPVVSDPIKTCHRSVLTVPGAAHCVCSAAYRYKGLNPQVEVRKSLIKDRIHILRTISGVSLHAYQGFTQYQGSYDSYSELGLHLYGHNINENPPA